MPPVGIADLLIERIFQKNHEFSLKEERLGDMECLSDFLRSGTMDDSVVGNKEHRMNNEKNNVENILDEEGKIIYYHFSENKDTGSFQSARGNVKESEELEDNMDIENSLQTILNCDNTGSDSSLEAASDDMESVEAEAGNETNRSKFNKTFEDDEASCKSDKLYDDLRKALGKDDNDIVDREYQESYNKENIAYDENSVNMKSDIVNVDENTVEPNIIPLKLRPIKDLLRSGVNEPFAPQQKQDSGQILIPREKTSPSLQPQPPKSSVSLKPQPSSWTPSLQSQPPISGQANEKSKCWPSTLSQAAKQTDLFTVHNSQPTGLQAMSSQSQPNQTMSLQSHDNQLKINPSMMPQLQISPSMLPQSQSNQSVLPQLKTTQSTMPPSQVDQILLSQGNQSSINHSLLFPSQGNQLFLPPQISQSIQTPIPIFHIPYPYSNTHHSHQLKSSSPVQYRTQNEFVKYASKSQAALHPCGALRLKPGYQPAYHDPWLPSEGGPPPVRSTSPKPASTLQTYHDPRLPPGWHLTGVLRQSGVSKGRFDFYIHGMGKKFRSLPEIVRFYALKEETGEVDYIDYKGIEESIKTFRKQLTEQQERETGKQD